MNSAYVYLQLYKLFDTLTPTPKDCGMLCNSACCQGDDSGMYLFPGEMEVYKLLNPNWSRVEKSDFSYTYMGKKYSVPIIFCNGACDRYQRPLACRIFPLTPILDESGKLQIITDPRAKSICPLSKAFLISDYDEKFVEAVKNAFLLLMKNKQFAAFMVEYTKYINEFLKFF